MPNNGACVPLTGKEVPKIGANEGGGDGEVAPPDVKADVMGTTLGGAVISRIDSIVCHLSDGRNMRPTPEVSKE